MRITVLGKSPAWQDAGGACSGYLVQEADTTLVLDCGNGVFAKLRSATDYTAVDAVLITHLHADHFLDLVPFSYGLLFSPGQQRDDPARPPLHVPRDGRDTFRRVVGGWGDEDLIERAFALSEYHVDDTLEVGPLRLRFHHVPHFIHTHAVEITTTTGSGRFTFGADTGPSDELVAFARGTDLLMVEATLPEPEEDGPRGHLTAAEAGEHGRRAGAARLVLTHISDELDSEHARAQAERTYGGPVEIAAEGATYDV